MFVLIRIEYILDITVCGCINYSVYLVQLQEVVIHAAVVVADEQTISDLNASIYSNFRIVNLLLSQILSFLLFFVFLWAHLAVLRSQIT